MDLCYENIVQKMLEVVPELKPLYDKEINWYDGEMPGVHLIFGDVFNPYLISLLMSSTEGDKLKNIFNFLEEMAASKDVLVQEVLACTILERLGDYPHIMVNVKIYMGNLTQKISDKIEKGWGRNKNL